MSEQGLAVSDVRVRFGQRSVLDGVSFTVDAHEVVCLAGPSGAGKSTLLRAVAGLQPLDGGRVAWNGRDLASVAPHRRNFGMVFQDGALFPHLNVTRNVAFGLRWQRLSRAEIQQRVDELLELVGLSGRRNESTATLSGGERQRVALARALATRPELLLLDEPLAALDADLKKRLADDLRSLLAELRIAALYVTHDRAEAALVADRVLTLGELAS
jgi:thiamine transport system ATP-binding protein